MKTTWVCLFDEFAHHDVVEIGRLDTMYIYHIVQRKSQAGHMTDEQWLQFHEDFMGRVRNQNLNKQLEAVS